MEETSKKPHKLLLNSFVFLLGTILSFGLYTYAFEYKYARDNPYDSAYGAAGISTDGTHYYCVSVNPTLGCNKTISQVKDRLKNERHIFASIVDSIGILILSIFIWFVSKNPKKVTLILIFVFGSLLGFTLGTTFVVFIHSISFGYNP